MALIYPPTRNGLQKTLDAQLDEAATASMTLNNVTGVQNAPGVVVINRIDSNGAEKSASLREYISFTGTSGNTLTGLTRGLGSSTDQDHAVGSVVEFIFDVTAAQAIIDALALYVDPTVGNVRDIQGGELIIDADGDTSVTADTDDRIDWKIGGSDRFSMGTSDLNVVTSTGNIQIAGADPWRTITLMPGLLKPTTTSGCAAIEKIEAGTNDIDYDVLGFDASSDERAFANIQMPDSWDAGIIQFRVIWTNAGGSSAQTVEFELSGRSFANDDAIDQANGTAVAVTDTWIAQGDVHITSWSSDVTLNGTPAAGEFIHLELLRDVSADDLSGDARVIALQIRYKQAQYSD